MMPSGHVLYYPYTHYRDSSWLKLAALYYDGIARMIPEQFSPDDDNDVQFLTDIGFLSRLDTALSAEQIAEDFIAYTKLYLSDKQKRNELFPELANSNSNFRIQPGKMASQVRLMLEELHPQQRLPEYGDDFDLDAVTGGIYMAFLAKRMSAIHSLPIVTHDPKFQRLIYKPLSTAAESNVEHAESTFALASLIIETAIPVDIASVPLKSVIEFREKHRDSRLEFVEEVRKLGAGIDLSSDRVTLEKYLASKQELIRKRVRGLRISMKDVGIASIPRLMSVSIPSFIAGKWAFGIETGHVAIGALALSAVVSLYTGYRDLEKLKRDSPWAYVLSLRKLKRISSDHTMNFEHPLAFF